MALFSFIFVLLVYFEQAKCAPHLQNWFTKAADETDNVQLFRGVQSKVNSLGECLFTSESDRKSLERSAKIAQNAGATERQLLAVLNCVEKSLLANCEFRGDAIKVENLHELKQIRESGCKLDKLTKPFADILSRRLKILSELNSLAIFKITAIHNQVSPPHRLPKAPREDIIHNTFDGEIIPLPHTSHSQLRIEQHQRELPEEAINLGEVIYHAIVEVLLPALDLMNNQQRKAVLGALHRCDLNGTNEITTEAHSQRIQAVLDSFSPCGSSPNIQNRGQHPHDKQLIERGKQIVRKANRRKEEDEEIEKRINKTFCEPTGPLTACGIKINEKLEKFGTWLAIGGCFSSCHRRKAKNRGKGCCEEGIENCCLYACMIPTLCAAPCICCSGICCNIGDSCSGVHEFGVNCGTKCTTALVACDPSTLCQSNVRDEYGEMKSSRQKSGCEDCTDLCCNITCAVTLCCGIPGACCENSFSNAHEALTKTATWMSTCRCLCGVDKEEKNDAELCCMYACCAPGCSVIIPCACVDTTACVAAECGRHAVKHGKSAIDTGAEVLSDCCQKGGGMCCTRSPDNEIQTFEVGTKNYVEQVIMRLNKLEHGLKEEEMKHVPSLTTTRGIENMGPGEEKDSPSNSGKMVRSDAKPTNLPKKEGAVAQ